MSNHLDASISLCDHMNPGNGYQIRITDARNGADVLFTSRHPVTGEDLLAYEQCLEVLQMYSDRTSLRIIELHRFAIAHHELRFGQLCVAALAGEGWAIERCAAALANLADINRDAAHTLRIIESINTSRPDGAIAREGFAP
jgi:hypothetical protein